MPSRVTLGAAFTLALVATSAPAADAHCRARIIDLGALPGSNFSVAMGISERGEIAGYGTDADNVNRALRWVDGRLRVLDVPSGGGSEAFEINASGTIVGRYDSGKGAFVWRHGRATALPGLPGGTTELARRISDSGIVAGTAVGADGREHAVLWKRGRIIDVGIPPGYDRAMATDVGDDGEAVVTAFSGANVLGFRWRHGRFEPLPGLGGLGSQLTVDGARGETAGMSLLPGGRLEPTVWDRHGTPRSLGFLGRGDSAGIVGTDDAGAWVGIARLAPGGPSMYPFLTRGDGPMLTLPGLAGRDGFAGARDIDRRGNVVGLSTPVPGIDHATLWTCAWRQAFLPR